MAASSYASRLAQVLRGFSSSCGTLGQVSGISIPNTGCVSYCAWSRLPFSAAQIMERVPPELLAEGWFTITEEWDFSEQLERLDCPLLLAKHEA